MFQFLKLIYEVSSFVFAHFVCIPNFLTSSSKYVPFLVVGGLLSAHLLSHRAGLVLEPGWPCSGPLLRLAEDMARRLLPGSFFFTMLSYFKMHDNCRFSNN